MDHDQRSPKQVLEQFCEAWNQRSLNPRLYPMHMAPKGVAEALLSAQIDEVKGAIELPADINNSEEFLAWARSFEVNEGRHDSNDKSQGLEFLQVMAKDAKGRAAVFDVDVSMTPAGKTVMTPFLTVRAYLANLAQRSTWIDPRMLAEYDLVQADPSKENADMHGHERVELFRKALQSMIRESLKQAKQVREEAIKREGETATLQAMIDEVKLYGTPLKALADDGKLEVGVGLDDQSSLGAIHFEMGGVTAKITTSSSSATREAFANLINAVIEGKGYVS